MQQLKIWLLTWCATVGLNLQYANQWRKVFKVENAVADIDCQTNDIAVFGLYGEKCDRLFGAISFHSVISM